MTTKLRKLLEDAESALDTYRNPDIAEAREALNALLQAAGLGWPGDDEITHMCIGAENSWVSVRYSVRCCEQTDRFDFPTHLLDAEHPLLAARVWGLEQKCRVAEREIKSARSSLAREEAAFEHLRASLAKACSDLSDVMDSSAPKEPTP